MKNIVKNLFVFVAALGCFVSTVSYAATDQWYKNNLSCVIDRGNPGRTGEYLTEPLGVFPQGKFINELVNIASSNSILCYKNFMIGSQATIDDRYVKYDIKLDSDEGYSPHIIYKDNIYAFSYPNLVKYNVYTQQKKRQLLNMDMRGIPYGVSPDSASMLAYNDILYIGFDEKLLALDLNTFQKLWSFELSKDLPVNQASGVKPTIKWLSTDGDRIFFSAVGLKLRSFALDLKTGKLLWSNKIGGGQHYTANNFIRNYAIAYKGFLYVGAYKLDAVTGEIIWHAANDYSIDAVSDDIIIASTGSCVSGIDPKNGKELWSFDFADNRYPVLVKNFLYFISRCGDEESCVYKVNALNKYTGKKYWSYRLSTVTEEYDLGDTITPYNEKLYIPELSNTVVLEQKRQK